MGGEESKFKNNSFIYKNNQDFLSMKEKYNSSINTLTLTNKNKINEKKGKIENIQKYIYNKNDVLGSGTFGRVYEAMDSETNEIVAMKEIYFEDEEGKRSIINEISIMKCIDSYYSIKLIDSFCIESYYYIIMEKCDDNLLNYVKKKQRLEIDVIQKILIQLNDVMRFLYNKQINHRDIKPNNILIKYIDENDFIIKLTDYGFGKALSIKKNYFSSVLGTEIFMAPEVKSRKYDYKADLYSIGVLLYFLYFGELPNKNEKKNYQNNDLKNLIENLIIDYEKRLDWNNYINHPFIINYFNKYLKLNLINDKKYQLSEIYLSDNKTKYIGQILNGTNIIEGKGISFYKNGNKRYEGNWKEGKAHGKGIRYYENGNKYFEGDFKNGEANGKGIKFNEKGNKIYEGEWKEGVEEGEGKAYFENGILCYEGEWKKGIPDGKGISYFIYGNIFYEGEYKNGKENGKGIIYDEFGNKRYEGDLKNGKEDGKGNGYYKNGNKWYVGDWKLGERDGYGICYYENGNKWYEGEYKNGKEDGKGTLYDINKNKAYEGNWKNGIANGEGISYYKNGKKRYEGNWIDGKTNGQGKKYYENGNILYDGNWKNDKFDGIGIKYYENGNKFYEGNWKDNKQDGEGILYNKKGEKIYFGNFNNGILKIKNLNKLI